MHPRTQLTALTTWNGVAARLKNKVIFKFETIDPLCCCDNKIYRQSNSCNIRRTFIYMFRLAVKPCSGWIRELKRLKLHLILMDPCIVVFSFHLAVCLTTGPKPLPKRALHIVRSRASSFKLEHPRLSLRSSSNFLRLLPCLSVTSIPPLYLSFSNPLQKEFLRKMWPIHFTFRLRISCRIFICSLTLSNTASFLNDQSNCSFPSFSNTTFQKFPGFSDLLLKASKFQHHIKLCSKRSTLLASSSIPSPMC
jgi:hypothetical protein